MWFIQRLAFVVHVSGFLSGLIALPIFLLALISGKDEFIFILLFVIFLAPVLGWSLVWLLTGKGVHFVPLNVLILNSLPIKDNFLIVLLLIPIITFSFIVYDESDREKRSWERSVFGTECLDASGQENIIGRFSTESDQVIGEPYFCSDFLEETLSGETFCTWNDGGNKDTEKCRNLRNSPKPDDVEFITPFLVALFALYFSFILLTLIKIILRIRTS